MTRYLAFASEYPHLSPSDRSRVTHILPDDGTYSSRVAALAQFHDFESSADDDGDRDQTQETERGFLK